MIPLNPKVKLVLGLILVGGVGALQAIAKVEPTWSWIGTIVQVAMAAELYFTIPGTAGKKPDGQRGMATAHVLGVLLVVGIVGLVVFGPRARHNRSVPIDLTKSSQPADAIRVLAQVRQEDGSNAYLETPMLATQGCEANGQLNPVVINVTAASLQTLACAVNVYVAGTSIDGGSPNWASIALALASTCGMDVEEIVSAFGGSSPVAQAAQSNAAAVHARASSRKAELQGGAR